MTRTILALAVLGALACGARSSAVPGSEWDDSGVEPDADASPEGERVLEAERCTSQMCGSGADVEIGGGRMEQGEDGIVRLIEQVRNCGTPGSTFPPGVPVVLRGRSGAHQEILGATTTQHAIPWGFRELVPFEVPLETWEAYDGGGHCIEILLDPDDQVAECREISEAEVTSLNGCCTCAP